MSEEIKNRKLNGSELELKEKKLLARKQKLDQLEEELREREQELKAKDAKRKQVILRLPESLWREIARWAEDDFRSINGQIEYILTRSLNEHRKDRR